MKIIEFINYEEVSKTAYFQNADYTGHKLYCINIGDNLLPKLCICSLDGEPHGEILNPNDYKLADISSEGNSLTWEEFLKKFETVKTHNDLINKMSVIFR